MTSVTSRASIYKMLTPVHVSSSEIFTRPKPVVPRASTSQRQLRLELSVHTRSYTHTCGLSLSLTSFQSRILVNNVIHTRFLNQKLNAYLRPKHSEFGFLKTTIVKIDLLQLWLSPAHHCLLPSPLCFFPHLDPCLSVIHRTSASHRVSSLG